MLNFAKPWRSGLPGIYALFGRLGLNTGGGQIDKQAEAVLGCSECARLQEKVKQLRTELDVCHEELEIERLLL